MKVLLVGSGGREHAIAWKLAKSEKVSKIFVAPGNGGTAIENKCENINITDIDELVVFARENNIDLTFVGPEDPLTKGITDKFKAAGLRCFGPDAAGAQLEGSKAFSKDFMKKYGYEGVPMHKIAHDNFVAEVTQQIKKLDSGSKEAVLLFYDYIANWILTHIAKADKIWANFVKEKI